MPLWLLLAACVAWLITGLVSLVLIAFAASTAPPWLWILAALPVGATLPFMILRRPAAYLLALLGSVGYAAVALTESIANPDTRLWAGMLAGISLTAFFILIPAVRETRRIAATSR